MKRPRVRCPRCRSWVQVIRIKGGVDALALHFDQDGRICPESSPERQTANA
jgi:hypothetical protein